MTNSIEIHPQLIKDCHILGELQASTLLLHKDSQIPWFILVPKTELVDLLDLEETQRNIVMTECAMISNFIKSYFGSPKINFGAIGNLVPQMHLHVVGRKQNDACWPQPVWGNLNTLVPYEPERVTEIISSLRKECGLSKPE